MRPEPDWPPALTIDGVPVYAASEVPLGTAEFHDGRFVLMSPADAQTLITYVRCEELMAAIRKSARGG